MRIPRSSAFRLNAACAAAIAAALLPAPASGQALVLGESAGAACFRHALDEHHHISPVNDCRDALERSDLSRRDRAATHVNRGIILMRRGDLEEALDDFDAAEALRPAFRPVIAVNRSALYVRMRRYEAAVAQADFAIANDADDVASAHFNRAVALEELGDTLGAYQAYREALNARPGWRAAERELERFTVDGS